MEARSWEVKMVLGGGMVAVVGIGYWVVRGVIGEF